MCRFVRGKLERSVVDVDNSDYFTVSHVWGVAEWRNVKGVQGKVLLSKSKAKFIERQLPTIVGDAFFWMDVLCIDQKDGDARVAVTQHIPTIFRKAERTILVRDGYGLRSCCAKAIGSITDWKQFQDRLWGHIRASHRKDDIREGVLSRLWVLEEIAVSNTVQVVSCKERKLSASHGILNYAGLRINEDLETFARAWSSEDDGNLGEPMRFIEAFVNNGVVSRRMSQNPGPSPLPRTYFWFCITSTGRSSKPRDYILATMPQFRFYRVPPNARTMTFTELFTDCADQLHAAISTLSPDSLDVELPDETVDIPRTIDSIPEPACLGDLVKLFHSCFLFADIQSLLTRLRGPQNREHQYNIYSPLNNRVFQLTLLGRKYPVDFAFIDSFGEDPPDTKEVVTLVQNANIYSRALWYAARIGELHDFEVETGKSRRTYLFRKYPKVEKDDVLVAKSVVTRLMENEEEERESIINSYGSDFDSREGKLGNCLDYIIRIAAMISCRVGLSAFEWSKTHLCPVSIDFRDKTYLGLVPFSALGRPFQMYLVPEDEREYGFYLLAETHPGELYTGCLFPWDL